MKMYNSSSYQIISPVLTKKKQVNIVEVDDWYAARAVYEKLFKFKKRHSLNVKINQKRNTVIVRCEV